MSTGGLLIKQYVFEEVVIGTQIWMKKNYDFGGTYPNNVETNVADYGKLYTWAEATAINFPGWHLPTYTEYETLYIYLGGHSIAGGKLKEVGTNHWLTPNTGADNSSGFSGVGAGYYFSTEYLYFKEQAAFWTSTEYDANTAISLVLIYDYAGITEGHYNKTQKNSVRLIKN